LAGGGAALYSMLTDYELGAVKLVPMPVHLALDAASGAFLASSPWLSGFAKEGSRYWLPHVLVGATEMLAAAMTKTRQDRSGRRGRRSIVANAARHRPEPAASHMSIPGIQR
jgi:hypothetical protein